MKPRILFVAPSAYTLSGLATWLDYLEPGLAARGWDVVMGLVAGPRHHRPERYAEYHRHARVESIESTTCTAEGRHRAVAKALRRTLPDIVATVNIPDAILAGACERSGKAKPRLVMTCHGILPELFRDMQQLPMDGVVCTNRLACRLAQSMGGVAADRIKYAPYGVDPVEPCSKTNDVRADAGSATLRILYAGRFEQDQKRVGDLPKIMHRLSGLGIDWQLELAGTGPDEGSLRQAFQGEFSHRVHFHGQLSADTLRREIYPRADVLLLTSRWETGPIVIWEAMAQRIPVVSTRYVGSGLEQALIHGQTALLFAVGDTEGASEQLARLAHDRPLRRDLADNAWEMVRRRYSISASVSSWDVVLREMLTLPPQSTSASKLQRPATGDSRLNRILGPKLAESVRKCMGRVGPDSGPGGEWCYSFSGSAIDDQDFWSMASREDATTSPDEPVALVATERDDCR